jgi:predicted kinase
MCDLAFSGKSSVAAILTRELKAQLISLDAINDERGLRGGEGMSDRQWEETSAIAMDRLAALVQQGRSVVVDDTFSHRFLRDRCKHVAHENGSRFLIIFMDTSLAEIETRRLTNDRRPVRHRIRDEVFWHHRDRFQFPTDDEPVVRIRHAGDIEDLISCGKGSLARERASLAGDEYPALCVKQDGALVGDHGFHILQ